MCIRKADDLLYILKQNSSPVIIMSTTRVFGNSSLARYRMRTRGHGLFGILSNVGRFLARSFLPKITKAGVKSVLKKSAKKAVSSAGSELMKQVMNKQSPKQALKRVAQTAFKEVSKDLLQTKSKKLQKKTPVKRKTIKKTKTFKLV